MFSVEHVFFRPKDCFFLQAQQDSGVIFFGGKSILKVQLVGKNWAPQNNEISLHLKLRL